MLKDKHISNIFWLIILLLIPLFLCKINAQEVRVIDNKGTLINFNNNRVFDQTNTPNPTLANVERDIWLNRTTNIPEVWHNNWIKLISKTAIFPTIEITAPLTLGDEHHTVIITDIPNSEPDMIILPTPNSSNKGRVYIIKNTAGRSSETNIEWKDKDNTDTDQIAVNAVIILQSDGSIWQQIN